MVWQSGNRAIWQGGRQYTVIVHEEAPEDGGGYWAEVEELPGCFASGDTTSELEVDVSQAIECHTAALRRLATAAGCQIARLPDCQ